MPKISARCRTRLLRHSRLWAALLAGWLAVGSLSMSAEYHPVLREPRGESLSVRVIIGWREVPAVATREALLEEVASIGERTRVPLQLVGEVSPTLSVLRVGIPLSRDNLEAALEDLRADPAIAFAEPDRRRYPHALPNDPLFTNQWYLQATQPSALAATTAWDTSAGSNGIVIAVLDTGVRFDHPDLGRAADGGRLLPGYDFVSGDSNGSFTTANDGNGRDADPTDPGDWVTSSEASSSLFSGACDGASDSSWHGTRVSGLIGARSNNALGVTGITWTPWILPVRVLGKCGGYDSDILTGMRWAAGLEVSGVELNPYPARVLNLSLGSSERCSNSYQGVIDELTARGAVVVASAGNESGPVSAPANCNGVVAVVALRHVGTKVGFSNLGSRATLGAPGGNCVNEGANQPCLFSIDTTTNSGRTGPLNNTYTDQFNYNVGTSFSAPLVAGIAGLMLSVNASLSSAEVTARLRAGVRPWPAAPTDRVLPVCRVPSGVNDLQPSECVCTSAACGAGMANAPGAVSEALRPIATVVVPSSVTAGQNLVLQGGGAAACGRSVSSYAWSVVSTGTGGGLVSGSNSAAATVVAPSSGTLQLRLTVTDSSGAIDRADVNISATSASSAARASVTASACPTAIVIGGTPPAPTPAPTTPVTPPTSSGGGGGGSLDPLALLLLGGFWWWRRRLQFAAER
ncbi:MAG: GlyGly-CTERM sorting domain-containing protein [Sinobacteraceae bacterium]|nr:GlyGly-CTERM sorting domain-containing protein [Nevskiaceae bacterium]